MAHGLAEMASSPQSPCSHESLVPPAAQGGAAVERVSHSCRGIFTHQECSGREAAWDFVLDRAADCLCGCHRHGPVSAACGSGHADHAGCAFDPSSGPAWERDDTDGSCWCVCHLPGNRIAEECRRDWSHRACTEHGQAWDLVRGVPADCLCRCHPAPLAGRRAEHSANAGASSQ
jgi:hypothetical protein